MINTSTSNLPFKDGKLPTVLKLQETETQDHNYALKIINSRGKEIAKTQADQLSQTSFLSIHKTIKKIDHKSNLSEATRSLLQKTKKLAHEFELIVLELETSGMETETVSRINALFAALKDSQKDLSSSQNSGLTGNELKEIDDEIDIILKKVSKTAHWLEFSVKMNELEEEIPKIITGYSFYKKFEAQSPLATTDLRGLQHSQQLCLAIDKLIHLYQSEYVKNKSKYDSDSNLARLEVLHEKIDTTISSFIDSASLIEGLLQDTASRTWKNPSDEKSHLEQIKKVIIEEADALDKIQRRLHSLSTGQPEGKPNVQSKHWISSVFHGLTHPLETVQRAIEKIEEYSPLPAYTATSLVREKETLIAESLNKLKPLTSSQTLNFKESLEKIEKRLLELKGTSALQTESKKDSYLAWLDDFASFVSEWPTIQRALEVKENPSEEDISKAKFLFEMLKNKKHDLAEMESTLRAHEMTPKLKKELNAETESFLREANILANLLIFRADFNTIANELDDSLSNLMEQSEEITTGKQHFSADHDIKILQGFSELCQLYKEAHLHAFPLAFQMEIISKIKSEIEGLAFARAEYGEDLEKALKNEVDKAILGYSSEDKKNDAIALVKQLVDDLDKLKKMQVKLHQEIAGLKSDPALFQREEILIHAFKKAYSELGANIKTIKKQKEALEQSLKSAMLEKSEVSIAQWRIKKYEKEVEHSVKLLSGENDDSQSVFSSALKMLGKGWLYSLYHHDRISSLLQFSQQTYNAIVSGESPLKPTADIMSKLEFARQIDKIPEEKQAKTSLEMNLMEGIIKGFISYTSEMAREYPTLANYLEMEFKIFPPAQTPRLSSGPDAYELLQKQGGPDTRSLSSEELNLHMIRFLGQEVKSHFQEQGIKLGSATLPTSKIDRTPHFVYTPDNTQLASREPFPQNPLSEISQNLVDSIKENRLGVNLQDNEALKHLQNLAKAYFGTPLPKEWIEEWVFGQDWSDTRLDDLKDWMTQSLQAQAWDHLSNPPEPEASADNMAGIPSLRFLSAEKSTAKETQKEWKVTPKIAMPAAQGAHKATEVAAQKLNPPGSLIATELLSTSLSVLSTPELARIVDKDPEVHYLHRFLSKDSQRVSDKLYGHVIGHANPSIASARISGVRLEGSTQSDTFGFQLKIAEDLLQTLQKEPLPGTGVDNVKTNPAHLINLIRQLKIAKPFADILIPRPLDDDFGDRTEFLSFRKMLKDEVAKLRPGDSFFFPGGWTTEHSGHSTVWEVTAQDNNCMTVRHYNTGAGISYHSKETIDLQDRYLHFVEIVDVEPSVLTSSAWVKGLWDIGIKPVPAGTPEWQENDIYNALLTGLNGKMSSKEYSKAEMKLKQFVGICSMESLMTVLDKLLEDETSSHLYRFWTTLKATTSYFDSTKGDLTDKNNGEELRRLLDDGLKALASHVHVVAEDGSLTDAELLYVDKLMENMSNALVQAEQIAALSLKIDAPMVSFKAPIKPLQAFSAAPQYHQVENIQTNVAAATRPYQAIDRGSWKPNPSVLTKEMSDFLQEIHQGNHETKNFLEVQKAMRQVIQKIPILDETFWNEINDAEAIKFLSTLSELSKEFLWSFLNNDQIPDIDKRKLSSEDYLVLAKILTLTDKISNTYQNPLELPAPNLFQKSLVNLVFSEDRRSSTLLFHPINIDTSTEWKDQVEAMKIYWKDQLNHPQKSYADDLFQLNSYPAGNDGSSKRVVYLNEALRINLPGLLHSLPKNFNARISKTSDVTFLAKWAESNPHKVEEIDPKLKGLPPMQQGALIFQQIDKIPFLKDLFAISYVYDFFLTGSFDHPNSMPYDFSKGISVDLKTQQRESVNVPVEVNVDGEIIKTTQKQIPEYWEISYKLFGRPPHIGFEEPLIESEFTPIYVQAGAHLFNSQTKNFGETISPLFFLRPKASNSHRRRLDTNEIVLIDPTKKGDHSWANLEISVEQFREILNLSSLKKLQIPQTLGYFSSNIQFLFKPDFQLFFKQLMTEESLFEDWLLISPAANQQLEQFFNKALNAAHEIGDVNTEIFLAGISRRLEDAYQRVLERHPDIFSSRQRPQFVQHQTVLGKLIQSTDITDDQRAFAHRERALSLSNTKKLSANGAAQLLESVIYNRLFQVPKAYQEDINSIREMEDLIRNRFSQQLREFLNGPEKDAILTQAQRAIFPYAMAGIWTSPQGFPYFISPDGSIEIQVLDGKLTARGNTPTPFDPQLLKLDALSEVFAGQPPKMMTRLNDRLIEVNRNGVSYHIIGAYWQWNRNIQRQFDDRWYELQDKDFASNAFHNQALVHGMQAWYTKDSEGKSAEILLVDRNTGKAQYRAYLEKMSDGSEFISKVEQLNEHEMPTGLCLVDASLPELNSFHRFEAPEYILAWAKDDQIKEISLPRFGLAFSITDEKGRQVARSEQLSGYSLSEDERQHVAELGDVNHYLHLKREEKDKSVKELVLFPRFPILKYSMGSFRTETLPDQQVKKGQLSQQKFFSYHPQGDYLIPTSSNAQEVIEANLYLAMIHLSERHLISGGDNLAGKYSKAKYYLDRIDLQMLQQRQGLNSESKQILEWIGSLDELTQDNHADAVAIRLKAYFLLLRDRLDYPSISQEGTKTSVDTKQILSNAYSDYLTHRSLVDKSLQLKESEERIILKHIGLGSAQFINRLDQLTKNEGAEFRHVISNYATEGISMSSQRMLSSLSVPSDALLKLLEPSANEVGAGLLLRNINSEVNLMAYYKIAKGEMPAATAIPILNEGMGLHLSSTLSPQEMLEEMKIALKLNLAASLSTKAHEWTTPLLLAVLHDPESFLAGKDFEESIAKLRQAIEDKAKLPEILTQNEEVLSYYKNQISQYQKYRNSAIEGGDGTYLSHYDNEIAKFQKAYDDTLSKHQPLSLRFKEIENEISGLKELLKNRIFAPSAKIMDDINNELRIPISSGTNEESERLKKEKIKAQSMPPPPPQDLTFAQCIELRTAPYSTRHTLEQSIIPEIALNQMVTKRPPKPVEASAAPIFTNRTKDPFIGKVFSEASESFEAYVKLGKGIPAEYDISDSNKIDELSTTLKKSIEISENTLKEQLDSLLKLVNKEPETPELSVKRHMRQRMGAEKLISLDEVVRSLYLRDKEILHDRNPALTETDIRQIFSLLQDYLLDATHLQQQRVVLENAQKLSNAIQRKVPDAELQDHIRQFIETAQAKREYSFFEHPEFLVFEYFSKFLIWKEQVATLEKFNAVDQKGALIELAMAMGKSHVIAPLQAWLNADGTRLAVVVMPESLIMSMAKDMQEKLGTAFGQMVRMLPIKRESITLQRLQHLYEVLDGIRKGQQVLMWTASDIQSLFNQWVELNEGMHEKFEKGNLTPLDEQDFAAKHQAFLKIFQLLVESGVMNIDEIHQVFDILKSHNFTFGSPKTVHSDISAAVTNLFKLIASDPEIKNMVRWEFLPSSEGKLPFTEDIYHKKIKGKLIDKLIERGLDPEDVNFRETFKQFSSSQKQLLKQYLVDDGSKNSDEAYHFVSNLSGETGRRIKNELAVLKESLKTVLPATANKKPLVHFGLDSDGKLTIPYHDGRPTVNSLFGSVLERLFYTAMYDLAKGIPESIIRKEIEALVNQYKKDTSENRIPDLSRFNQLCGGNKGFSLLRLSDNDYSKITEIINQDPQIQLELIHTYRYSSIEEFIKEIQSSAHIFPYLSKKEKGLSAMSGTLYNVATFPNAFQSAQLSDTQSKTLDIIRRNSPQKVATLLPFQKTGKSQKIESIYQSLKGPNGSIIDSSGYLSGLSNEDLAKEMLTQLEPGKFDGVVYYDGDVLKVIKINEDKPILYDRLMNKERLIAFWDLSHNTGSDIPLGQTMTATMIVGKDITLVNLMQAAWRLRGLAKGQSVNFMLTKEDKAFIQQMLIKHLGEEISEGEDLTLDQLLSYTLLNQSLQESQNNYRAVKERMKMALVGRVVNLIWDSTTPANDAFKIYEDMRSLFLSERPEEPWDIWGASTKETPTPKALEELLESWKNSPLIQKIRQQADIYKGIDVNEVFAEWTNIIENVAGPLPSVVTTATTYGQTVEQQTQQQTEQQTEQKTQQTIEQRISLEFGNRYIDPRQHIPASLNIFLQKDYIPSALPLIMSTSEDVLLEGFFDSQETGACITANDMLRTNEDLSDYKDVFDEALLVSLNLSPVQGVSSKIRKVNAARSEMISFDDEVVEQLPYKAFDEQQKDCSYIQMIQSKETGKIKVKMLDLNDAYDVMQKILEEKKTVVDGKENLNEVNIGLYQLKKEGFAIDIEGSQPLDLSGEKRSELMQLIVQAKFVAGVLHYTNEEMPFLKQWISNVGSEKAVGLLQKILNPVTKSDSKRNFPQSTLAKCFLELGIKV